MLALLLLEQLLGGIDVNALTGIGDLQRPFYVVWVESQLVDHVSNRTVNGVLNLRAEWCGRACWLEWWAPRNCEVRFGG